VPVIYFIFEVLIKRDLNFQKADFWKKGRILFLKVGLDFLLNS